MAAPDRKQWRSMIRIKICCISSIKEARLAIATGAHALGLVSDMPSGPGVISEDEIAKIISAIGPFVIPVLLTSRKNASDIVNQYRRCRPTVIQLCEPLDKEELNRLGDMLPGVPLVRVIHVSGPESLREAQWYQSYVSALLLDTGQRKGPGKQLGGTGQIHDWTISAKIVESVKIPVVLAGGLTADNVRQAIEQVRPYGVDVCSGVRTNDQLDPVKLSRFIASVHAGN